MPTGTATVDTFTNIWQGPAKIFANVALPGAGGRITLFTDGTPEGTANPSAVYIGTTKGGAVFSADRTYKDQYVDEYAAPFRRTLERESCSLEGEFSELLDFTKLALLLPGATKTTGAQYEQITSGGLSTFTSIPICIIGPTVADPTKFVVIQIYSALSAGGLKINVNRGDANFSPFKFEGQLVSGRAAGDALWTVWKSVT